jgi:FlaA1/EpsC-like NDP-sugar epimerase
LYTEFHFLETPEFKDQLIQQFGLNVRSLESHLGHDGFREKQGKLHRRDPNMCCYLNKVEPLITGGCGFIDTNLIRRLLKGNGDIHSIWVHDNLSVGGRGDLEKIASFEKDSPYAPGDIPDSGVELVVGDVRDSDSTQRAAAGADVIVHLAAQARGPYPGCLPP